MTNIDDKTILSEVSQYYSEKLARYGQQPEGVDWKDKHSQQMRFVQLCKLLTMRADFSINDLGCGYGALLEYLAEEAYTRFSYRGFDVSQAMIEAARQRACLSPNARFFVSATMDAADYVLASGIFNVRGHRDEKQWLRHIHDTLDHMNENSHLGFAFNCLTSYSDADKQRDHLYYTDPVQIFDRCKNRYANNVALLHDYGLYEFTIIVRKQL